MKHKCKTCEELKDETEFGRQLCVKKGVKYPYRLLHCKKCTTLKVSYRKIGTSEAEVSEHTKKQGGKCAICSKECPTGRRLAIDHNHETGIVRGLLCLKCNTALGAVNDNVGTLKKMISYLETRG